MKPRRDAFRLAVYGGAITAVGIALGLLLLR